MNECMMERDKDLERPGAAAEKGLRFDLSIIASWIEPGSRVLDLGCGEGELLKYLMREKKVIGAGIEQDEAGAAACINEGLSVIQGDINVEIEDYPDGRFDYAILSRTLQQVYEPTPLLKELLRIGKKAIVSFPNFSHWGVRLQLLLKGHAPLTSQLPFQWYDTPNIRVITINDFRDYAKSLGCRIYREAAINTTHKDKSGSLVRFFPNMFATYGIFLIGMPE